MITKETSDFSGVDFRAGEVILIDKPFGWTSFKVVHIIKKISGTKKVGHAGTLDPRATGLLILCTGKKTREITKYQEFEKTYLGTITLGKSTPSMDLETEVIEEKPFDGITKSDIEKVKDSFLGEILQTPPMYSALKVGGKTLYNLARKGKTVRREPRKVNVSKFLIKEINLPDIHFEITCSKGTYIRVIANDLGEKLGAGGVLSSLRRTRIGVYSAQNALKVEDLERKLKEARENLTF
jgi:tRNA pseudouridine55 synthase